MSRIPYLPAADPLTGDETMPIIQDGTTKRGRFADMSRAVLTGFIESATSVVRRGALVLVDGFEVLGFNRYGEARMPGVEFSRAEADGHGVLDILRAGAYRLLAVDTATGEIIVGAFDSGTVDRLRARIGAPLGRQGMDGLLELLPATGQSNAVAAGVNRNKTDAPVLHATPLVPDAGVMFNTGTRGAQSLALDPATLTDLVPAFEQEDADLECGETQGAGMLAQYHRQNLAAGEARLLLFRAHGSSGKRLDEIENGTQPFANALIEAAAAQRLAALYGMEVTCLAVTLTHGEADRGLDTENTFTTKADYKAGLVALRADYNASLAPFLVAGNPDIAMLVDQLACAYNPLADETASQIAVGMYELARDEAGFYLSCPKYTFEMIDTVHFTPAAQALIGEYHGKLRRQLRAGTATSPMVPTAIARAGTAITLTFGNAVGDLVLDTATLPAAADMGFEYDGAAITDVAVAGNTVTLTLAADAAGTLRYAYTAPGGASDPKRSGAWGNLRDSDPTPSVTNPALQLHNWAPVFEEIIA